ncbi:MAG: hypothetical protein LBK54_10430 [Propionibacteriaceae bacterium]|nr:hypothetical protein [Propionibacteriaceae bacterium]
MDANVLAKPLTRTLLVIASAASGYAVTWSGHVEDEANRHLRPAQKSVTEVRVAAGRELSEPGEHPERFAGTEAKDRQVLADAVAADAAFLVTENVADFNQADLESTGVVAVNPDLFLSIKLTAEGYREAVEFVSRRSKNPHLTPAEFHIRLGRAHPLTVETHKSSFPDATPLAATHNLPAVRYRGNRCLNCLQISEPVTEGLCARCAATVTASTKPSGTTA